MRSRSLLLPCLAALALLLACPGGGSLDDDDVTPPTGDDDTALDDDDMTPSTDDDDAGDDDTGDDDDAGDDDDVAPPPCDDDALENDDYTASANLLEPGAPAEAIACLEDDDWWEVVLAAGSSLEVVVDFSNEAGDIDLELLDLDDGVIDEADSTEDTERVTGALAQAGSLYVRVFLYGDDAEGGGSAYTISATVGTCPTDPFEPNDAQATSAPLGVGSHEGLTVCVDDDWYAVEMRAGDALNIDVLFNNGEGDVDAALDDADGAMLTESVSTSHDEHLGPWEAPDEGPVYLRVYLYEDQGGEYGNSYSLQVADE